MNYREILEQLRTHVTWLFQSKKDPRFLYHNLDHTEQVVENVVKISNHYKLSDHDFFIVCAAGWFHDIGYLYDSTQHELKGTELMTAFLKEKAVSEEVIEQIKGCIMATKMPQKPDGLLQQIVCDADLYHLGSNDFKQRNKLMRKEVQAFYEHKVDKEEWNEKTIQLFKSHHFHTDYGRQLLNEKKAANLKELERKLVTAVKQIAKPALLPARENKPVPEKKKKEDKPEKGVETMFRITSTNHQRLSDMADNKAHIMISTNSIILSVILSLMLKKLEDNPHLIIPTMLLLIVCVVTMVFSILATRPTIPEGVFTGRHRTQKS